jgi:hypothetical protein
VGTGVEKAASMLACCRSGFVTALIVTEDIAAAMQALHDESSDHHKPGSLPAPALAPGGLTVPDLG